MGPWQGILVIEIVITYSVLEWRDTLKVIVSKRGVAWYVLMPVRRNQAKLLLYGTIATGTVHQMN